MTNCVRACLSANARPSPATSRRRSHPAAGAANRRPSHLDHFAGRVGLIRAKRLFEQAELDLYVFVRVGFDVGNQTFEFGVGLADFVVEFVGADELASG